MINSVLEIEFSGWTATPRMPFIISGSQKGGSICLQTPTYSLLLGLIGCCMGRIINPKEVKIGFHYSLDFVCKDMESRRRLQLNNGKLRPHTDGNSPYLLEFHSNPKLTLWIDRLDWKEYFLNPVGTPALGRSQDLLKIEKVKRVVVTPVEETTLSGCMLPFNSSLIIGGQLVQLAEAYEENEDVGSGRSATKSGVFMAVPYDNKTKLKYPNLYHIQGNNEVGFYLHSFQ